MANNEMDEILSDFIVETTELLEGLDEDLIGLEKVPKDAELLNKIFRAFHTIKGSSSFLGFEKITELTHKLEDLLNSLRRFEIEITPDIMDAILISTDKLKLIVGMIKSNESINDVDLEGEISKLTLAREGELINKTIQKKDDMHSQNLQDIAEGLLSKDIVDLQIKQMQEEPLVNKKTNLSDEEIEAEIARLLEQRTKEDKERRAKKTDSKQNGQKEYQLGVTLNNQIVQENPSQKAISNSTKIAQSTQLTQDKLQPKQDLEKQTIRVDVKKLDDLMDLAGELVLAKNRLARLANLVSEEGSNEEIAEDLSNISSQITLVTTDMQMAIMKTRMVEIGKVFNKFPRIVRDICRDLQKEVSLVIEGADTELDKSIVEEINEPFVHLIRNAIDHGIELSDERVSKGKNKMGKIILSASQEGNHIVISIEDDGRGLDKEKIKQKAISSGIVTESEAAQMSENDIFNLVFLPGFSTATEVSSISGRGVGMDVVKTNIEKLNGIINIKSKIDQGTKITIKIPLTLAIIQSLLVKSVGKLFAIPLANVVETVRISLSDIESVQNKDVLRLRGSIVPLIYLGDILKIAKDKKTLNDQEIYVVIVSSAEKQLGVVLDSLVNQEEVVIKPLGNYLGKVKSIAGATIMGDGSVALILDVVSIIKESSKGFANISSHIMDTEYFSSSILVLSRKDKIHQLSFIKDKFSEYNVVFDENIDLIYAKPSSLIFLDLSLPNAIEVINEIRDLPSTKKSYIIGLSEDTVSDKMRFDESGLNAIIGTDSIANLENIINMINKKLERKRTRKLL